MSLPAFQQIDLNDADEAVAPVRSADNWKFHVVRTLLVGVEGVIASGVVRKRNIPRSMTTPVVSLELGRVDVLHVHLSTPSPAGREVKVF